ncbi:MAG: lysylphosphatidylglycerol synthase transmembrane domain-containing protein [Fibrobacterota bacterium]
MIRKRKASNDQAASGLISPSARKILGPILQSVATVVLVAWILWRNDAGAVVGKLQHLDLSWLLVGICLLVVSVGMGAIQWERLLFAQGLSIPGPRLLRAYSLGMFLNFVLPSGVGGDVVRAVQVHRDTKGGAKGVAATLLDRFAGLFTLALFAALASALLAMHHTDPLFRKLAVVTGFVAFSFCVTSVVLFSRRVIGWIAPVSRLFGEGALLDNARNLRSAFLEYRAHPALVAQVVALSVVTQFLRILVHYFCAKAMGLPLDLAWILLFVPIVALISVLPISVGGWGLREGTQKTFFSLPGVMPGLSAHDAASGALALAVSTSLLGMLVPAVVSVLVSFFFAPDAASAAARRDS